MKHLHLILHNDIKRRLKSPMSILIMLLIPLMMTGLIGLIFAPKPDNKQQLPKIKVLLADQDKNLAAKFLVGAFDAPDLKEMFQVTMVTETEGQKLMKKGKASALVIIPEHFSSNILNAKPITLHVIKNPSEQFLPEIVEEFMNTTAIFFSGAIQIFEPELKVIRSIHDFSPEKLDITQLTPYLELTKQKLITLKKYLSPLLLTLKKENITEEKETATTSTNTSDVNIFGLVMPGMAVMFLLFIIEIFMRDILTEREDGKLQRIMFSPIRALDYIFARICSGWLMGMIVTFLMIGLGCVIFNIHWGNYFYLFLLVVVTCFWIAAFFAVLNAIFKNKNQAGALTSPIILVFSAFGGSMLPISQLPQAMQWVSNLTLNQWFIKGMNQVSAHVFPTLPVLILLSSGCLLCTLATILLHKRIKA